MSVMSGLRNAKSFGGGSYLGVGKHRIKFLKAFVQKSEDPLKGGTQQFISEVEMVQSSAPDHTPGTTRSIYRDFKWPGTPGDIRDLILAVAPGLGYTAEQMKGWDDATWDRFGDWIIGAENPLGQNEVVIDVEGFNKPSKSTGTDFTKYKWGQVVSSKKLTK